MAGQTTLIVTTRSGVRPLGVRGEPLHNAAPQLRRVVRRRLGDDAAGLLADPQMHEDGKAIDWYADWPGAVQPWLSTEVARRSVRIVCTWRTGAGNPASPRVPPAPPSLPRSSFYPFTDRSRVTL